MFRTALNLIFFTTIICNSWAQVASTNKNCRVSDHEPVELNRSAFDEANSRKEDFGAGRDTNVYTHPVYSYAFHASQINREGFILYNNDIEKYLNQLKDWILGEDVVLKKKAENIHIYLMDKPSLNAFTNDYGNVYVNIETIAKLDHEEELLYLLSHEIAHVLEKHSLKSEKHSKTLNTKITQNEKSLLFSIHSFSQKQELSADKEALKMLKGRVPIHFFSSLLEKMGTSGDPVFEGRISYSDIFFSDEYKNTFLNLWDECKIDSIPHISETLDRYSTHPSIGKRKIQMYTFIVDEGEDKNEYISLSDFESLKKQAQDLLLTTYIHDELYLEALDFIVKSLKSEPNDTALLGKQIELLVLICQDKYIDLGSTYLLNDHGGDYTDLNYLSFRNFILKLNPIDFNFLCISSIREICKKHPELANQTEDDLDNLYQLLYQNQSKLFKSVDSEYHYVSKVDLPVSLDSTWAENAYDIEFVDSLEALGFDFHTVSDSSLLITEYLDQPLIHAQVKSIKAYNKRLELFSQNVSWDEFNIGKLDPVSFARKYKRNKKYLYAEHYDQTAKVALLGCDQYQLLSIKNVGYFKDNFYLDFKKSLELVDRINKYPSHSNHEFDFSNSSSQSISVTDNYLHRIGNIWLNELRDEPLIVSRVENEIKEFYLDKGIQYVTMQICIVDKHFSYGIGTFISFVEITFDLENDGIVYMAKIGSKRKDRPKQIEQLTYSSSYHKTHFK